MNLENFDFEKFYWNMDIAVLSSEIYKSIWIDYEVSLNADELPYSVEWSTVLLKSEWN